MLNVLEAEELFRLCRGGRLYEVEKWIGSGRSLVMPSDTRSTPLGIAIDMGFHSLAELLARHETQEQKNKALRHAVREKSWEYVYLLLEHGADPIADSPFAVAFSERIQRALRPFVDYRTEHPELATALQEQLDAALRTACDKRDLKWVSLLMWAGADPRSSGPTVDEEDPTNPEHFTTAMHSAAYCEDVKILKRLKPDPQRDDVGEMLRSAAMFGRLDVIKYLIEDLGAQRNEKPNGGATVLDACLKSFGFAAITTRIRSGWGSWKTKASKYDVSKCLDTMQVLLAAGAVWRPVDARAINDVRRNLLDCDAEVTLEVIDALMKHNACTRETIEALLKTPAIKRHVTEMQRKLDRLGFDVRTKEQKEQEARQKEQYRRWALDHLMKRYPREKIYEEIWAEPMIKVAKRYNISDVALAKVCRKLNIPRPGRGYWEKKAAGKPVSKRPALPDLN